MPPLEGRDIRLRIRRLLRVCEGPPIGYPQAGKSGARLQRMHRPRNNRRTKPTGDVRSDFMLENTLDRGLVDRGPGGDADMDMWADRGAGVAAFFLRASRSIRCSRACD